MKLWSQLSSMRYSSVRGEDFETVSPVCSQQQTNKSEIENVKMLTLGLGLLLFWLSGLLTGFLLVLSRGRPHILLPDTIPRVPISDSTRQKVHHNLSFQTPPPEHGGKEAVWDSLMPNGLGFVVHPVLAPEYSQISVFHQLHCLYLTRRAYYSNSEDQQDFDTGVERAPHIGHCFDYLRQSIMCAADSSIEPTRERVNGNPNWGFEKQCRSYEEIKHWAEEWRVFEAHGFIATADLKGANESKVF